MKKAKPSRKPKSKKPKSLMEKICKKHRVKDWFAD